MHRHGSEVICSYAAGGRSQENLFSCYDKEVQQARKEAESHLTEEAEGQSGGAGAGVVAVGWDRVSALYSFGGIYESGEGFLWGFP